MGSVVLWAMRRPAPGTYSLAQVEARDHNTGSVLNGADDGAPLETQTVWGEVEQFMGRAVQREWGILRSRHCATEGGVWMDPGGCRCGAYGGPGVPRTVLEGQCSALCRRTLLWMWAHPAQNWRIHAGGRRVPAIRRTGFRTSRLGLAG